MSHHKKHKIPKKNGTLRILGIDPGTHKTGYGIIESDGNEIKHVGSGDIKLNGKTPISLRLHDIFNALDTVIEHYDPDVIAVEDVFIAKNPKSSLKLGQAQGMVLLKAAQTGINCIEYSTREVKEALAGYGNATKEQVQFMVKNQLKINGDLSEDASDALAVAICHGQSSKLTESINRALSKDKSKS
ncbi:crossover junction endodeoxyribonuclease RuvC [bacterium]|nr:crossover junction endodeoxyribonuclease RuvC [bacterium]